MEVFFRKGSHGALFAAGLAAASLLSGCASDGLSPATASLAPGASTAAVADMADAGGDAATSAEAASYDDNAFYAGRATYRCDNGESLEVNNTVTQVALGLPDGSVMELPASPADSHTRYVKDQYAFVFDGAEALYFRPKAAPATCKR